MAREVEAAVLDLVRSTLRVTAELRTPDWLLRPGPSECSELWPDIQRIYAALTSTSLPVEMPVREHRRVDAVLETSAGRRIVEVDEKQHFNAFRATTLHHYPQAVDLAFDRGAWIRQSESKKRLEGGGFSKPRPPLFPGENGRHKQRAFRDALCDLLPAANGYLPTLRIGYFEIDQWLHNHDAVSHMKRLLSSKGVLE